MKEYPRKLTVEVLHDLQRRRLSQRERYFPPTSRTAPTILKPDPEARLTERMVAWSRLRLRIFEGSVTDGTCGDFGCERICQIFRAFEVFSGDGIGGNEEGEMVLELGDEVFDGGLGRVGWSWVGRMVCRLESVLHSA